jgi:hypothetical protein
LRRHYIIPVGILIAILVVAFFFSVFAFLPLQSVNFNQSYSAATVPGVDAINLNFQADVANVNVIPTDLTNQLVSMDVSASGSMGVFGSSNQPVKVTFTNQTVGNTMTVTPKVSMTNAWPFSFNLKVTCNIYVERSVAMNISAQTTVGKITLKPAVDIVPQEFRNINLKSTTGNIEANLTDLFSLNGDISISTTAGSTQFNWDTAHVFRNTAVNLASTTGSIMASITQNGDIGGNVSIATATTTGSVNLDMNLRGDVGTQITSHTTTGSISVNVQNFNGNKSPIYSSNYPANSNFIINQGTTTGSIHITAAYQDQNPSPASTQEQVRDAVMTYIQTNHPETAKLMHNLNWTGGYVDRGLIVGAGLYTYISGGWNVTMTYPVVPNPIYTVTANYSAQGQATTPSRVTWTGTWQNGTITETSLNEITSQFRQ